MGEPPAAEAAPAKAAAARDERDLLLATKLNVPGLRSDLVPRPRLAQRLDEARRRGLVLACAPAGYGKTVLLAEWVRRVRHPVAALDRVRPGIGERMGPLLGPPPPPSFEPLVTALINEVAGQPEAFLLVLDDYHVISSRQVHESLGFLLEHRPPGLHLALTSRSDPPLALARLRARGQLTELRAAELRFTTDEAAALLQQVAAAPGGARPGASLLQVPEAVAAALAARTEGWAAGLQLAGLSLRGRGDVDGFIAAFTGSHRFVLDYLAEEVLEHQSEQARTFLLETSVLERLSGPLCDAVTGRPGSQALLEEAERAGLFVVPLDEVRGWWRYHHLFADLLRARLGAEHPDRAAQLHRNAAAWYAERGLADDAIRHAVAAGELTRAARLIEQHFDAVHSLRGEAATVQRWLAPLPADLVRSRPRLLLAQAVPAATGGRLEAAEQLVDAAERAYAGQGAGQGAGTGEEPFEPTIGPAGSLLVNVPATIALVRGYLAQLRGDARGTAEFGARAVAESRDDEWILRSVAQVQLAVAGWLDGRLDEAERAFADGIAGRRAAGLPTWGAWASYELGQVQHAQGRLDAAARTCEQALEAAARTGQPPSPAAGPAYVGLAEVAYQRNELDSALDNAERGIALCRSFVYTMPLAAGLATLAWIRQAAGDPAGALDAMDEALRATPGPPPGLLNPIPARRARLLIAAQRAGSGFSGFSGFGAVAEVPLGCLARLQRALAAPGAAPDARRVGVTAAAGLIDPLTSRELEVLELLAAGRSNQVIASQLVVTLDTVKKHVSHVLGKLGAANRTEAVARARELSLIRR